MPSPRDKDDTWPPEGPPEPPPWEGDQADAKLCKPVSLVTYPLRDGASSALGLISMQPTQINAYGPCRYLCGDVRLDERSGTLVSHLDSCGEQQLDNLGPARHPDYRQSYVDDQLQWTALGTHTRGALCGRPVSFLTGTDCIPTKARGEWNRLSFSDCGGVDSEHPSPPPGVDPWCYTELDCLYCLQFEDQDQCSIFVSHVTDSLPCTPDGGAHKRGARPGMPVWPVVSAGGWDIFGDNNAFTAQGEEAGLPRVKYYLAPTVLAWVQAYHADCTFEGATDCGLCCTWLCNYSAHWSSAALAWAIRCHEVPHGSIYTPVFVPLGFSANRFPAEIAFHLGRESCFLRDDQNCLSTGPDPSGEAPFWEHIPYRDPRDTVLDSLAVDLDMRLCDDAELYPSEYPDYVAMANDCLRMVGERVSSVDRGSNSNNHGVTSDRINRWLDTQAFTEEGTTANWDCATAPVVRRADGTPWEVFVFQKGGNALIPAELVLWQATFVIRVSGDPGIYGFYGPGGYFGPNAGKRRVIATADVLVYTRVRLKQGWEEYELVKPFAYADTDPCNLEVLQPADDPVEYHAFTVGEDTPHVPRIIKWRGLRYERPWSKHDAEFMEPTVTSVLCCKFLEALDGIEIWGEVDKPLDPDARQRYEGDIVVALHTPASELAPCQWP